MSCYIEGVHYEEEHFMKKFMIPLLMLSMIAVFAGCNAKQSAMPEEKTAPVSAVQEEVQETVVEEPVQGIANSEAAQ